MPEQRTGLMGQRVPPSHVEKGLLRYVVGLWAKCLPPYRLTLQSAVFSVTAHASGSPESVCAPLNDSTCTEALY